MAPVCYFQLERALAFAPFYANYYADITSAEVWSGIYSRQITRSALSGRSINCNQLNLLLEVVALPAIANVNHRERNVAMGHLRTS
jgi:hypothetical protein